MIFHDEGQLVYLPGSRSQAWSSRVLDSPVSAENIIYEAFVFLGEIGWCLSAFLEERGSIETLEG